MSNWNQDYCDEIAGIDNFFQRFFTTWQNIDIDYEKERPDSLDDFKQSIDEMLEAYEYFANDINRTNEEE